MRADFLHNWRSYVKIRNQAIVGIKFTDRREQLICGLFSRVDGLSQEIIKLLKSEGSLGCPPMMRSALESYIDLKCLKKDEKYVYEFEAMHVDSQIKYYKAYSDENIWFKEMSEAEVNLKIEELKERKNDLLEGRKKPMRLKERFEMAEESHAYDTIYHNLSNFVHSSVVALANQYDGKNQVLNMKPKESQTNYYYSSTINLCCATLIETLEALGHKEHIIDELQNVMKAVNKKARCVSVTRGEV